MMICYPRTGANVGKSNKPMREMCMTHLPKETMAMNIKIHSEKGNYVEN
jgi:hypothetical protein